jgi:general secretion pathway protein G
VAIMSLIATTVVVAVIPKFQGAQDETALNSAREIRNAVVRWRATRGGDECPSVTQLRADKEIDTASKIDDPWGSQFKVVCSEDEITVTSLGRDKKENTKDDLSVPKKAVAP